MHDDGANREMATDPVDTTMASTRTDDPDPQQHTTSTSDVGSGHSSGWQPLFMKN